MNIFETAQLFGSNVWFYGGAFILVLSLLVFVHEWGHYIVARLFGIHVETFSIGFGKELFGFNDKKGTRWKVAMIPLGGYVKLYGDVDPASYAHDEETMDSDSGKPRAMTEEERGKAFFAKPLWNRALVVAAGPAINYIFAIFLLSLLFIFNGKPVTPPIAAAIIEGSSAEKHGFLPHDEIVSIDGKDVKSFEDIQREMMIALDETKDFVVLRDGTLIDIQAQAEKIEITDRFGFKHSMGRLGLINPRHVIGLRAIRMLDGVEYPALKEGEAPDAVREALLSKMGETFKIKIERSEDRFDLLTITALAKFNDGLNNPESEEHNVLFISDKNSNSFVQYSPLPAIGAAAYESWVITRGTLEALGQMITGTRSATELGGLIRIGALAGDMAKQGMISLVLFAALLSINLGLINLFPIPLLDGGHLVFYAIEGVLRRPVSERVQEYAFRFGMVFLIGIMVFANLNDIVQLLL